MSIKNEQPPAVLARLDACPGCGDTCTRVIGGPGTRGGPKYWAGCDVCRWRTFGDTEAEAIEAWNKRASLAQQGEAVEPRGLLGLPDWAIASAYRKAVGRMTPESRALALVWASEITVAADHLHQEWEQKRRDYATNPLALAEWMRRHWRTPCGRFSEGVVGLPPELVWIYESLHTLAALQPAATSEGENNVDR